MTDREVYLQIDAPEFEVLPRPRLEGDDRRVPDASRTSFQSAIIRSFTNVPETPFEYAVLSIDVPGDDDLPAAGTMKAVIDAVVGARVIANDRTSPIAVRLTKYNLTDGRQPVCGIDVLPRESNDPGLATWVAYVSRSRQIRKKVRPAVAAVSYVDRSGVPGAARFSNPWVEGPGDYERQLRERWQRLLEHGRVSQSTQWMTPTSVGWALRLHLPATCTEDGDNALLYVIDMLELARRDALGSDAGERTLDQLLWQVVFQRDMESGVFVELLPIERGDLLYNGPYYLFESGEAVEPFDADSP